MATSPSQSKPLFRGLKGRAGSMPPGRIAAHQRARLEGATIEAVGRRGFDQVTIAELVALAGVSKSTFYRHFIDKQDCFAATFEAIVEQGAQRIEGAFRSGERLEARLEAGLRAFAQILESEPLAASLVLVGSFALGATGVALREGAGLRLQEMIARSFRSEPEAGEVSELEVRAIVAGIARVAFRALNNQEPELLRDGVPHLVEWALGYRRPRDAARAAGSSVPAPWPRPTERPEREELDWQVPPASKRARAELSQRERIVRAVAQLVAEQGYAALKIPEVSCRSGTSNEAFYRNFASKQEAFLAALDALAREALQATTAAYAAQDSWAARVRAGVAAAMEHTATHPLFARLVFFELGQAGRAGLERADVAMDGFMGFLAPERLPHGVRALPAVVAEAIGGGAWGVIQHELANGNAAGLVGLAPQIADLSLVPLGMERGHTSA